MAYESNIANMFPLGSDLWINRLGYGAMRLTGQPGNFGPYPNWEEGVNFLWVQRRQFRPL